jgi:hypothetical protein
MSTKTTPTASAAFEIGWRFLLAISALFALWHIILMFTIAGETTLFMGAVALNLLTAIIVYLPFRHGEKWAWYSIWIQVIVFAAPFFITHESYTGTYLIVAGLMALELLLTSSAFFRKEI